MSTDDDLSEHLDPELDAAIAGVGESSDDDLPGPFTLPRLVVALHVGAAAGLAPFAVRAFEAGETSRALVVAVAAVGLLASGVAVARLADRRY